MNFRSIIAGFLSFATLALTFVPTGANALVSYGPADDQAACSVFEESFVSDTTAVDAATNNAVVAAYTDGRHTASIPGATWVWPTEKTTDAKNGEDVTIARDFVVVGTPMGGSIDIAVDNTYRVFINGNLIGEDDDSTVNPGDYTPGDEVPYNFTAGGQDAYSIPASALVTGVNTLVIEARNWSSSFNVPEVNPGAILYKVAYTSQECPTTCTLAVTSDQATQSVTNAGDSVLAYTDGRHTASIDDAEWIWSTEYTVDPKNGENQEFSRTFTVPTDDVQSASLEIAADNAYLVTINGTVFGGDDDLSINPADYFGGEVPYNFTASGQDTWDITSLITPGINTITFNVRNWSSSFTVAEVNPAAFMYRVEVTGTTENETCERENTPPVITVLGNNPITLTVGDSFTDPGAAAFDQEDGDITPDLVVGGDTVDTNTVGTYVITYNVQDSEGLAATEKTRTVVVEPTNVTGDQCILPTGNNITIVDLEHARLRATNSTFESALFPVSLPAGDYKITLQSYDGYSNRVNVSQPHESFAVNIYGASGLLATSGETDDLADKVLSDYFTGVVNESLTIGEDVTAVQAIHPYYPTNNANSVEAVCASFELLNGEAENTPPTLSADPAVTQVTLPYSGSVKDLLVMNAVADDAEDGDLTSDIVITYAQSYADRWAVTQQVMLELGYTTSHINSLELLLDSFGLNTESKIVTAVTLLESFGQATTTQNNILVRFLANAPAYTDGNDTPTVGYYGAFFDVADSDGASAPTDARIIEVLPDTSQGEIPVITVSPSVVVIERGASFDILDGVEANDFEDGNITGDIVSGGDTLDVATLGTYTITYDVTDSDGNDAVQKTRTIQVIAGDGETGTVMSCFVLLDVTGQPITNPNGGENFQIDYNGADSLDAYFDTPVTLNTELADFTGDAATCITAEFPVGDYSYDELQILDDSANFVAYAKNQSTWNAPLYLEAASAPVSVADFEVFGMSPVSDGDITVAYGETQYVYASVRVAEQSQGEIPVITVDPTTINLTVGASAPNIMNGVQATDNEDGVITPDIVTGGDTVDTNTVGTYTVTYDVTDSDGNDAVQKTRTYIVSPENGGGDNPPTLTLVGNNPMIIYVGQTFTDPGATAADVEDGDLTDEIVIGGDTVTTNQPATFTITYDVADSDGNTAPQVTRTVEVQILGGSCSGNCGGYTPNTPPAITLEGDNPLNLLIGQPFNEPDYVANDKEDGVITPDVVIGGDTVDTSKIGTYTITYNVTDSKGLPAPEVTRTVIVSEVKGAVFPNCELYFTEWLQIGDRGAEVLKMQQWLNDFLGLSIAEDGIYGPETAAAVGYFQSRETYASIVLDPWGYTKPTYRWYKTTRMLANHLTGCDEDAKFLEDVGRTWQTTDQFIGWVDAR